MSHAVFQFGDFVIDPATRELWHAKQRIALPPKSFECLAYLLQHRERAVGRDELISAVWGRVDVSDAVLAQTLLRARRAVGDTGSEQTTIRTVPRFGYRWIVPVESIESDSRAVAASAIDGTSVAGIARGERGPEIPPEPDAATTPSDHTDAAVATAPAAAPVVSPKAPYRIPGWAIPIGAIAVILAAFVAWRSGSKSVEKTKTDENVAAVLPVTIADNDPESAWIRLGGMDYIGARLRDSGKIAVLPSSQIVALAGDSSADESLRRVATATQAKWLVQPRAQHDAHGWRVSLVASGEGKTREAEATASTPLAAAEQASEQLLAALDLPHAPRPAAAGTTTPITELVQRVDAALLGGSIDDARALIDGATDAQRAEPALRVREGQLEFRRGHVDAAEQIFTPIANSATALPVDVQAPAMMGLGAVAVRRADFPLAEKHYAEALAALGDAGDANLVGNAYTGRGVARAAQRHFDVALADFGRARIALERAGNHLDAAAVDVNLGITENERKRYAQAIPYFDRAMAVHERFNVRDNIAVDLLGKGNAQLQLLAVDDALATSDRASELAARLENKILVRAIALQRVQVLFAVGRLNDAQAVLDALPAAAASHDDGAAALYTARIALAHGDADRALAVLRPALGDKPQDHLPLLPDFVAAAARAGQLELARTTLAAPLAPSDDEERLDVELAQGRLAAADGQASQADAHFSKALALADQNGVPMDRARAGGAYADFLIRQHQLDKASAVVGDLAAFADRDFGAAQATVALYHALGDVSLESAARGRAKSVAGERDLSP